jgi:hypothetical protein|tara:strand:- start:1293 stop:1529 length:237 start_codon:yes stop_codon:yes gene_type:complete
MPKKRIHRTVIQVEVLSEEPFDYDDLDDIKAEITHNSSGVITTKSESVLVGLHAVNALGDFHCDAEFLNMDEEGNEIN